ncbi:Hsp70 family protein [Halochromatium glycolicum]|uniref:Sulfatase-modifying factor enzyme-like domain-containing protein n=1 Tax=Halochromatium glycolicum TaxID=85075 RepID=A0AAJ0X9Z7_9GAMM|nr:Hsp70 family protein [Halochromatium glycolicum]MBK1704302.1 hypothetical protein [Halochromatium glycolicum]
MSTEPSLGIDFGTTTSSMAWVDPRTGEARIIKNAEGEEKTPSVVYFGDGEPVVGTPAEHMLEDDEERRRVVASVKRELVNAPTLALPGRRVKPVEVAAAVLGKLKRDAEELHFNEPVARAVITCPAAFGPLERDEIAKAARLAGFAAVELLEEPVAAALAYSRDGRGVGKYVLVYDLGGGTFDLALLREQAGGFELAMEPKGLLRCGGDDFDLALYEHCERLAEQQWGERLDGAGLDLGFLRDCRKRKENLSAHDKVLFSSLIAAGRVFKHTLTRAVFEDLIRERVEATVRLTAELVRGAEARGQAVETVVLIGGSSRIPLIQRQLAEALPVAPRKYGEMDVAVALGAAYFSERVWPTEPVDDRPAGLAQYRAAVEQVWSAQPPAASALEGLGPRAGELGLDAEQAAAIERGVMGETKEAVLARLRQEQQKRRAKQSAQGGDKASAGAGAAERSRSPRPSLPRVTDLHGEPAELVQRLQRETAAALGLEVLFRDRLQDGGEGPEMLVIPPGRFLMGSPADEAERFDNEGPQHPVTFAHPFAIGRFAVTFAEYDAFCANTGRTRPDDNGWGRGRHPVIRVSWDDALAYCDWLSAQTGRRYRLPSEAEWEYAARAGTTTAFWWGNAIDPSLANYNGNYSYAGGPTGTDRQRTLTVNTFQPNPFGLYQVHGNVWEWCQDQWHGGYQGAPSDGAARGSPDKVSTVVRRSSGGGFLQGVLREFGLASEQTVRERRVVRGGSWNYDPRNCRAAYRHNITAGACLGYVGFRVCCGVPID